MSSLSRYLVLDESDMSSILETTIFLILTIQVELILMHLGTIRGLVMENFAMCGFKVNIDLCKPLISFIDVVSHVSSTAVDMIKFAVSVFHGLLRIVYSVL